ncbi:MAG: hypothetical protein GY854_10335 [Deltaproteobacteria bacterium]|nr:hypothetical protein [Deltaproteobacteria bacterium]
MKNEPVQQNEVLRGQPGKGWASRHAYLIVICLMVAVHLGLTFYFERPSIIFSDEPNAWLDFDTHIGQTWRVTEALDSFGKSWAYDVQLLAGNPKGTIFDADNKGWELWTYGLWKLGLSRGLAFNLFILLAHLMVPWAVWLAARLFGFDKWAALIAAIMGLLLWFFDAYPRWCWWVGMTEYAMAAYVFLVPLALFYRYLKSGKWYLLALFAAILSIAHINHPYSFVILVFPLMTMYVRVFKKLSVTKHLGIWGAAAVVIAANAYWLIPALQFWHYILNSAFYAQSTLSFFLTDYLGLIKEPLVTGVLSTRTGFRFIFLFAGILGLYLWRKRSDDRFWPIAVGLGSMLVLAYMGGYNLVFSQIQPYRHVFPAMYLSVIPAAFFLVEVIRSGALSKLPSLTYAVGGLGLLVTLGNLSRDALYFIPERLPHPEYTHMDRVALQKDNLDVADITDHHMEFRHEKTFEDFDDVVKWINDNDDGQGRILVEWWILGEHFAWRTDSQILGGFLEMNLDHSAANLFRRWEEKDISEEEARQYFEDYAVKWVILSRRDVKLEKYESLLKPIGFIRPVHRIYETTVPVSYFAEGSGRVEASMNRIKVTGTNPSEDLVLRFHWLDYFICKPECTIIKEPMEDDAVGFIRVKAPHPADFLIENGY